MPTFRSLSCIKDGEFKELMSSLHNYVPPTKKVVPK